MLGKNHIKNGNESFKFRFQLVEKICIVLKGWETTFKTGPGVITSWVRLKLYPHVTFESLNEFFRTGLALEHNLIEILFTIAKPFHNVTLRLYILSYINIFIIFQHSNHGIVNALPNILKIIPTFIEVLGYKSYRSLLSAPGRRFPSSVDNSAFLSA